MLFGLLMAVAACGDKREASSAAASRDAAPAVPGEAADIAGPERLEPVLSAEQRRSYKRHVRAGRELTEAGNWAAAIAEFERALGVIPMDARALSELGWAAFQVGDYDRARTANRDSVRLATGPDVRAASLYNLGRITEATGDRAEAEALYKESLALREDPTVRARLESLNPGGPKQHAPPRPASLGTGCGPSRSDDELCACLAGMGEAGRAASGATGRVLSCSREPRQIPGVELLFAGDDRRERVSLIAEEPRGWTAIARLGEVFHPEAGQGEYKELEIARFDWRLIGERKVLWVETVQTSGRKEAGVIRSAETRSLTLCVAEGSGLRCALQVPLTDREETRAAGAEEASAPGAGAPINASVHASGKAVVRTRRVEVTLSDSGLAKVILVEGIKDESLAPLLGEHRVWQ